MVLKPENLKKVPQILKYGTNFHQAIKCAAEFQKFITNQHLIFLV